MFPEGLNNFFTLLCWQQIVSEEDLNMPLKQYAFSLLQPQNKKNNQQIIKNFIQISDLQYVLKKIIFTYV